MFSLLLVPRHTGGWSPPERPGDAAAAERKKGRSEARLHLLAVPGVFKPVARQTLAAVSRLCHHGLDFTRINRLPVSARARAAACLLLRPQV